MTNLLRHPLRLGVVVSSVVVLVGAGYAAVTFALHGMQVRNCADLQTFVGLLQEYRAQRGSYPMDLGGALEVASPRTRSSPHFKVLLDNWGHPFVYQSDGSHFLLVSYGMGGSPDGVDYRALTRSGENERAQPCALSTDIFATEEGVQRCCGK